MNKEFVLNIDGSHNGYDYVDLGLPSGIKWATCNVGANNPEDEGLLFQFGRVDGYKYGDTNNKFRTKVQNLEDTGDEYIPKSETCATYNEGDILSFGDDVANYNMGGNWIMPTKNDFQELIDNTTRTVVTINGKKGMLFTSKINKKSLFVPFVGALYVDDIINDTSFCNKNTCSCLWTSEIDTMDCALAWAFCIYFDTCSFIDYCIRANGYSVRGILK